ncbi:MAG: FecR domain-containing protein [Odoribacteraceae bacterium]|nr:FecR domain-containing protein [Odoribacteraceae bacterium]
MGNKDDYESLASYLDRRLTHPGDQAFTPKMIEEDELRKLFFLWDECLPAESSTGDTWYKIEKKIKEHDARESRNASRGKLFASARTRGAVAAIIIAATLSIFLFLSREEKDLALGTEQHVQEDISGDTIKEVTLVVAGKKQIQIANNSKIAYSAAGDVQVNSETLNGIPAGTKNEEEEYNRIIVPKGRRSMIVLADSSQIWINSGSQVVYPRSFGQGKRKIFVEGEVYLQVSRDETRPFIASTPTFDVQVLGTSFNVTAYKEHSEASVVLVEGAVEVTDLQERCVKVQPNERVEMDETGILKKETVNAGDYIAWVNGVWILNGKSLKEVLLHLVEYYGQPVYHDPSLDDEPVYGKLFLNDDLHKVLGSIRQALSLNENENMISTR